MLDYILNGVAHGGVAAALLANGMNPQILRPFIEPDGRTYVTMGKGKDAQVKYAANATGILSREEWMSIDKVVIKAAKNRLRAVADVMAEGLTYAVAGGMGKTALETMRQSDINQATISMDGMRESQGDKPVSDLLYLPLPIIHKDFGFSAREVWASRQGSQPLDLSTAALAARRVAELQEELMVGATSYSYGSSGVIQGYINFSDRNTTEITDPTTPGWSADVLLGEVLTMKRISKDDLYYGPWVLYCSTDWETYMDNDYTTSTAQPITLRNRLKMIDGIKDVVTLDNLPTGFNLVLVQMTEDVVRWVEAMPITTLQWEEKGGMEFRFKVMTIGVPQIRSEITGKCGIVHGAPV